ncbi:MAG TPA: hypothetical protein VGD42_17095 [Lysobacter sp.]
MSIRIRDKHTGSELASISEADLAILLDHMEEEHSRDQDYFVDPMAVDALERLGASAQFVTMLRKAIGASEGIDIVWER